MVVCFCAFLCVSCAWPTWINQVTRLVSSRFLFVKIKSSFDDRSSRSPRTSTEVEIRRGARSFPPQIRQGCEFYRTASFFIFFFFSSPPSCALTRFRVLLVQRIAHGMRHSYFSDLANLRQMDATWPAKSRRLASVTTALAAPLLVIRSYVITLVLLVIDALTSCRSRDNFARGAGEMRHLLARIAPGRCGSGDERRRLYIKIAFKVGKATIPISSV